jgi:hypothetical protein
MQACPRACRRAGCRRPGGGARRGRAAAGLRGSGAEAAEGAQLHARHAALRGHRGEQSPGPDRGAGVRLPRGRGHGGRWGTWPGQATGPGNTWSFSVPGQPLSHCSDGRFPGGTPQYSCAFIYQGIGTTWHYDAASGRWLAVGSSAPLAGWTKVAITSQWQTGYFETDEAWMAVSRQTRPARDPQGDLRVTIDSAKVAAGTFDVAVHVQNAGPSAMTGVRLGPLRFGSQGFRVLGGPAPASAGQPRSRPVRDHGLPGRRREGGHGDGVRHRHGDRRRHGPHRDRRGPDHRRGAVAHRRRDPDDRDRRLDRRGGDRPGGAGAPRPRDLAARRARRGPASTDGPAGDARPRVRDARRRVRGVPPPRLPHAGAADLRGGVGGHAQRRRQGHGQAHRSGAHRVAQRQGHA